MRQLWLLIINLILSSNVMALPKGFVYLNEVDPSIIQDVKYFTHDNFVGRPIKGYEAARCILTTEAATALADIQQQLQSQGLGLKVFDCYRPQMAVDEFIAWSKDITDQTMKHKYYPNINKADVFKLNYVAMKSGHSRGSTVDLTIVKAQASAIELDMGTHFDYLDPASHPLAESIQGEPKANRLLLREIMLKNGFEPLETEWWHFTLSDEPFPDTYFNFPIK